MEGAETINNEGFLCITSIHCSEKLALLIIACIKLKAKLTNFSVTKDQTRAVPHILFPVHIVPQYEYFKMFIIMQVIAISNQSISRFK